MADPYVAAEKRKLFLDLLARSGLVATCARQAGADKAALYALRKANPEFAKQWDDALDEAHDILEAEAWRRATEGVSEPVYFQGVKIDTVQKHSDSLLQFLLKGNRPGKFRENTTIKLGNDGEPFKVEESPTAAARKIAFALAVGLRATEAKENPASDAADPSAGLPASGEDLV